MLIKINGKDYNFKMGSWWGPMYRFEDLMQVGEHPERKFNPLLIFHLHVMFYAVLLCDNEDLDLTLDEFLQALNDIQLSNAMRDFFTHRCEVLFPTAAKTADQSEKKIKKKS